MSTGLRRIAIVAGAVTLASAPAGAAPCANSNALGVHRVLPVDPRAMPLIGNHDYGVTLPLAPGEVVLTFDDGPLAPFTSRVLKALADECLQATFFMVGRQAGAEIDKGIAAVETALHGTASTTPTTPFFRFPYFESTPATLELLQKRGIVVFGADLWASDWNPMTPKAQLKLLIERLQAARKGIILLHDPKAQTTAMLPAFLRYLRDNRYRVVHLVPRASAAAAASPQNAK